MVETLLSQNHIWYHGNKIYARVIPKKLFHLPSEDAAVKVWKNMTSDDQLHQMLFIQNIEPKTTLLAMEKRRFSKEEPRQSIGILSKCRKMHEIIFCMLEEEYT